MIDKWRVWHAGPDQRQDFGNEPDRGVLVRRVSEACDEDDFLVRRSGSRDRRSLEVIGHDRTDIGVWLQGGGDLGFFLGQIERQIGLSPDGEFALAHVFSAPEKGIVFGQLALLASSGGNADRDRNR